MILVKAKQRTEQHLIDAEGKALFLSQLPLEWVVREYQPDYGIDYAVETFKSEAEGESAQTMGEHFFIQLKSTRSISKGNLKLFSRGNVEKAKERLDKNEQIGELETVRFQLEMSELITIERMGLAIPILLVVADLEKQACYFVCLNDYIDKILVPAHENYREAASRTIHVPVLNRMGTDRGTTALRWYAKRTKLYSAFVRFGFQLHELQHAERDAIPGLASYFHEKINSLDLWHDLEMWEIVATIRNMAKREAARTFSNPVEALEVWLHLDLLAKNHEDICREWFLPTALGYLASFA